MGVFSEVTDSAQHLASEHIVTAPTEAAFLAAYNAAVSAGGGRVYCPPGRIVMTGPTDIDSRISVICFNPERTFSGDVPDQHWSFTTPNKGTVFVGDGTFPMFRGNYTAKGSPDANFANNALDKFEIINAGFENFTSVIDAGDTNEIGLTDSLLQNVGIRGCTSWALQLVNFAHIKFDRVWLNENAHGVLLKSDVASSVLQCGNSDFEHLFDLSLSDIHHRGIVCEATAGSILNQMRFLFPQCNETARSEVTEQVTITSGSANITDVGTPANYPVGAHINFTSTVGGFTANVNYVVLTNNGAGTITVGLTKGGSAVTSNANATPTIKNQGMPAMEFVGLGGTGTITNTTVIGADLEGESSATIYLERCTPAYFQLSQVSGSGVYNHIVQRSSNYCDFQSWNSCNRDVDSSSVQSYYQGVDGSVRQKTGIVLGRTSSAPVLSLTPGNLATYDFMASSPGGNYIRPTKGIGIKVNFLNDGATLNANSSGILVINPSNSSQTYTLPAGDTGSDISVTYDQCRFVIHNRSANDATLATSSSQTFTNPGGTTSIPIPAYGTVVVAWSGSSAGIGQWIVERADPLQSVQLTHSLNVFTVLASHLRARAIRCLSGPSSAVSCVFPTTTPVGVPYLVANETSQAMSNNVKVSGQTGVLGPASGKRALFASDGTDMYRVTPDVP